MKFFPDYKKYYTEMRGLQIDYKNTTLRNIIENCLDKVILRHEDSRAYRLDIKLKTLLF